MDELTVTRPRSRPIVPARLRPTDTNRPPALPRADHLVAPGRRWAGRYGDRLRISDLIIVVGAVAIASIARFGFVEPTGFASPHTAGFTLMSLVVIAAWTVGLAAFRTRDVAITGVGAAEYRRVANASIVAFGLLGILFLVAQADTGRWFLTVTFPVGLVGLVASRWVWRQWLGGQRRKGRFLSRVLVVGRRCDVEKVVAQLSRSSGAAYSVAAVVVDDDSAAASGALEGLDVICGLDRVVESATALDVDGVVVAGHPGGESDFIRDLAWGLEGHTVDLILATSLANVAGPRVHYRPVDGLPLLLVEIPQFEGAKHVLKRVLDIAVSGFALLVLSPLFLVLSIVIRRDSPGPAFFSQERVGLGGTRFRIRKFRSMCADAPERQAALDAANEGSGPLFKLKTDPRVTRVGRVIRKHSLDELPQFWNVLVGEMSLVGPRPPLPREVEDYESPVHRRLYIKPGLTGMWQVNGRSQLSWEESVRLDLYYVENWSITGDLIIMWRTVKVILRPVGAF